MNIGIIGHGKKSLFSTLRQQIEYEQIKCELKCLDSSIADKLINIVENENVGITSNLVILKITVEEIRNGADYSKCENMEDIDKVHLQSVINRMLN